MIVIYADKRKGKTMRLIDADKIKRPMNMKSPYSRMMCKEIDNAPTVDAIPVVHAKWKGFFRKQFLGFDVYGEQKCRDGKIYYCSECNHRSIITHNYCPNCGARMDGEQ